MGFNVDHNQKKNKPRKSSLFDGVRFVGGINLLYITFIAISWYGYKDWPTCIFLTFLVTMFDVKVYLIGINLKNRIQMDVVPISQGEQPEDGNEMEYDGD